MRREEDHKDIQIWIDLIYASPPNKADQKIIFKNLLEANNLCNFQLIVINSAG
jgi:hypothetical protein